MAGTHAPSGPALAMPFIEDDWWSAENEGRMVDLSNCLQVSWLAVRINDYIIIITFTANTALIL